MAVHESEIVIIIAPDGACMTTLLNTNRGLVCASGGQIMFGERDLNNRLPRAIGKVVSDMFPNAATSSTP
jgi:ABC-type branched-subunit amino acid transport system ATPase component